MRIRTNCSLAITRIWVVDERVGGSRRGYGRKKGKKEEGLRRGGRWEGTSEAPSETEWHLHWLPAKSHLIKMSGRRLGTSQGNTVWMSSLEEVSCEEDTRGGRGDLIFFDDAEQRAEKETGQTREGSPRERVIAHVDPTGSLIAARSADQHFHRDAINRRKGERFFFSLCCLSRFTRGGRCTRSKM